MQKKILLILILLIMCLSVTLPALAFNTDKYSPDLSSSSAGDEKIKDIGNIVVKVIKIIGSAISVVSLAIIGIKYIYGSMEERAAYKETLMPYIVGAILLFGCSNLVEMIYSARLS